MRTAPWRDGTHKAIHNLCEPLIDVNNHHARLTGDGAMNWGISPHPVPLPMGEGTLELPLRMVQGSLLPWGEGQDAGRDRRSFRRAAASQARCKLHTLIGTSTFTETEACRDEPCLPSRYRRHDPCLSLCGLLCRHIRQRQPRRRAFAQVPPQLLALRPRIEAARPHPGFFPKFELGRLPQLRCVHSPPLSCHGGSFSRRRSLGQSNWAA